MLALLRLTLHDGRRAWKGFDWDSMDRLHKKGWISDPVGKARSVAFTDGRASLLRPRMSSASQRRLLRINLRFSKLLGRAR